MARIECLTCGARREESVSGARCVAPCPCCGDVGWANVGEINEDERRVRDAVRWTVPGHQLEDALATDMRMLTPGERVRLRHHRDRLLPTVEGTIIGIYRRRIEPMSYLVDLECLGAIEIAADAVEPVCHSDG